MRRRAVQRLLDEFWRAQAQFGTQAAAETLVAWSRINPEELEETAAQWLVTVLQIVRNGRGRSRRNAIAFYRLYRALETNYTVALPDQMPGTVTLGQLREEWARESNQLHRPEPDDLHAITVERFEWPVEPVADLDRAASISLAHSGPVRAQEIVQTATRQRARLDDPDFLAELESAGRAAAGVADREALRSGRDLVDQASRGDRRVRGWARVTDGDPCGFCSMLASRGAIYRSRASAGTVEDSRGDNPEDLKKYHPMCHCQVVPVYGGEEFLTPEARRLSDQWTEVTRGTTGDEARRVWRQHIEGQRRERRNT
jgi:hypothetical protein